MRYSYKLPIMSFFAAILITTTAIAGDTFHIAYYNDTAKDVVIQYAGNTDRDCWYQQGLPSEIRIKPGQHSKLYKTETKSSGFKCYFGVGKLRLLIYANNERKYCTFKEQSTVVALNAPDCGKIGGSPITVTNSDSGSSSGTSYIKIGKKQE